jgi:hypothetical protein
VSDAANGAGPRTHQWAFPTVNRLIPLLAESKLDPDLMYCEAVIVCQRCGAREKSTLKCNRQELLAAGNPMLESMKMRHKCVMALCQAIAGSMIEHDGAPECEAPVAAEETPP